MNITTYIHSLDELETATSLGLTEIILSPIIFSKKGSLSLSDVELLASTGRKNGMRIFMEWNILNSESKMEEIKNKLHSMNLINIDGFRVLDIGAVELLKEYFPQMKIQFLAEAGNHNLTALKQLKKDMGKQFDRMVVSLEIPFVKWKKYIEELDGLVEFQLLGPLELFYSPRKLLGHSEAKATSQETPHKNFRLFENQHGTLMDLPKDQCVLEHLPEITAAGLRWGKIDIRHLDTFQWLEQINSLCNHYSEEAFKNFKSNYPLKFIKGFFGINKSDVLFDKIKNPIRDIRHHGFLGQVNAIEKKENMTIQMAKDADLKIGDEIKMITPEGREIHFKIRSLSDLFDLEKEVLQSEDLGIHPFVKGACAKSLLYRDTVLDLK